MSDPLRRVLPADGQRTFAELREEFREANRERIRAMTRPDDVAVCVGKAEDGTPIYQRVKLGGLRTTAEEGHIHSGFNPKAGAGVYPTYAGHIPNPENMPDTAVVLDADGNPALAGAFPELGGGDRGLARELRDLARDAERYRLHDAVDYKQGDDDGPDNQCSPHAAGGTDSDGTGPASTSGAGSGDGPAPEAQAGEPQQAVGGGQEGVGDTAGEARTGASAAGDRYSYFEELGEDNYE